VPYLKLFKLVPNIEIIYIHLLRDSGFSERIQKASERGACKLLKNIVLSNPMNPEEMYKRCIDAVFCIKDSLENLVLSEKFPIHSNVLACFLSDFPQSSCIGYYKYAMYQGILFDWKMR
jgi:hypothetical protein